MFRTYKDVLGEIRQGAAKVGGNLSAAAKRQLRRHRSQRVRIAIALTALLFSAAALTVYSAWVKGHNAADAWAGLVLGTGSGGVFMHMLRKVWDDCSRTDLILILLEDAKDSDILPLLDRASGPGAVLRPASAPTQAGNAG